MKVSSRMLAVLLVLFSAGFVPSLRAESVGFPKDKPVFTIELPSGWKADWIEAGDLAGGPRLQLMAGGGDADLSIKALPASAEITDDASAKANLTRMALLDMQEMEATKSTAPEETTVAGHKAYRTKITTEIGFMEYTIFTPDGKTYFSMFSMNGGAEPVIAAIKLAE
ncbi:MAG: hypothetical protein WAO00_18650 [Chthoniobacterales bacterium]